MRKKIVDFFALLPALVLFFLGQLIRLLPDAVPPAELRPGAAAQPPPPLQQQALELKSPEMPTAPADDAALAGVRFAFCISAEEDVGRLPWQRVSGNPGDGWRLPNGENVCGMVIPVGQFGLLVPADLEAKLRMKVRPYLPRGCTRVDIALSGDGHAELRAVYTACGRIPMSVTLF